MLSRGRGLSRLFHYIHHADDGGDTVGVVIGERPIYRLEPPRAADGEHQRPRAFAAQPVGGDHPIIFVQFVAVFALVLVGHGFAGPIAADDPDDLLAEDAELKFAGRQDIRDEQIRDDGPMVEDVEHLALGHVAAIGQGPPAIEMFDFGAQELRRGVDVRVRDVVDAREVAVISGCRRHRLSAPYTRTTLPGFMMLWGSSASFSWRITATASPCSAVRKSSLP